MGDSAPDTWGRRLMQRAERRAAQREGRVVRTLMEADYLLGVSDLSRLGALRFRLDGQQEFQATLAGGVPGLLELGRLLDVTDRVLRDEETDDDLQLIFAPGSSLGGARPKASIVDQHNNLSIAKFPKEIDEYSIETWEHIAMRLAARAGITVPDNRLVHVLGRPVLLSRRFDRTNGGRTPFLSALSMMGLRDGATASYPELVDVLARYGAQTAADTDEIYRRMSFNVMVSNVDDHLRNHGFLWAGRNGWMLSPAYDLNPTPADVRQRILTTNITLDAGDCDTDLLLSAAEFFNLRQDAARAIIRQTAEAASNWRTEAESIGVRRAEIERLSSAFEHDAMAKGLAL